jgi:Serine aminopeptidase, S33
MADVTRSFKEVVVTFGEGGGLVGVLTMPTKPNPNAPHVILLNSGVIHRVGANRIYVSFARAFASAGIASLRFDLSGIGDSERRASIGSLQEAVHADIKAAIDHVVSKRGASRVVLLGLCSGAFDAFDHARRDERVAAVALLDMPGPFRNWSHLVYYVGARLFRGRAWRRSVKVRDSLNAFLGPTRGDRGDTPAPSLPGIRGSRSHEDMSTQLLSLLTRGVKLAFVFTGGLEGSYNHRLQFRLRFPSAASQPGVRVEFVPWSDHTLSTRKARGYLADWLRNWLLSQVAAATVAPADPRQPQVKVGV